MFLRFGTMIGVWFFVMIDHMAINGILKIEVMGGESMDNQQTPHVIKLFPLFNLEIGDVIRFTALDAKTKESGTFLVQVVALTLNRNLQWIPVFQFLETEFHLFAHDRVEVLIPENGALANGGYSVPNLPKDEFLKLMGVIALDHDFAFLNYDGSVNSVYAVMVNAVERMPGVQVQAEPAPILRFTLVLSVREVYARLAASKYQNQERN